MQINTTYDSRVQDYKVGEATVHDEVNGVLKLIFDNTKYELYYRGKKDLSDKKVIWFGRPSDSNTISYTNSVRFVLQPYDCTYLKVEENDQSGEVTVLYVNRLSSSADNNIHYARLKLETNICSGMR